jgi:integration host factor subunit beta
MTRSDLIDLLARRKEINTPVSEAIITEIFGSMADTLIAGKRIEIRGFGSFEIREYEGYSGRNPKTGVEVAVSAKKNPYFKVGKELRERVAVAA